MYVCIRCPSSTDGDEARTPPAGGPADAGPAVYDDVAAASSSVAPPGRGGARAPAAKVAAPASGKVARDAHPYNQQVKRQAYHFKKAREWANMLEGLEGRLLVAVENLTPLEAERAATEAAWLERPQQKGSRPRPRQGADDAARPQGQGRGGSSANGGLPPAGAGGRAESRRRPPPAEWTPVGC